MNGFAISTTARLIIGPTRLKWECGRPFRDRRTGIPHTKKLKIDLYSTQQDNFRTNLLV